jgi:acetyl-CoA synthetase
VLDPIQGHKLFSLTILGTVGEPINEEAWHWYDENIGKKKCPIIDTWWQTETGGVLISNLAGITPSKPTYATLPLPGVQPILVDENGKEVEGIMLAVTYVSKLHGHLFSELLMEIMNAAG